MNALNLLVILLPVVALAVAMVAAHYWGVAKSYADNAQTRAADAETEVQAKAQAKTDAETKAAEAQAAAGDAKVKADDAALDARFAIYSNAANKDDAKNIATTATEDYAKAQAAATAATAAATQAAEDYAKAQDAAATKKTFAEKAKKGLVLHTAIVAVYAAIMMGVAAFATYMNVAGLIIVGCLMVLAAAYGVVNRKDAVVAPANVAVAVTAFLSPALCGIGKGTGYVYTVPDLWFAKVAFGVVLVSAISWLLRESNVPKWLKITASVLAGVAFVTSLVLVHA